METHPSTAAPVTDQRDKAFVLLVALAYVAATLYNGPAHEIPVLFWSALALCFALGIAAPDRSISRLEVATTMAMLWLFMSWRASLSPSLSIAPAWSLLLLPLGVLLGSRCRRPDALTWRLLAIASIALVAALFNFVVLPDSAPLTLSDPNNVATLVNLTWPPALFTALAADRSLGPGPLVAVGLAAALAMVLLIVVESRAGMLVAAAMALASLSFAWRRGRLAVGGAAGAGGGLAVALLLLSPALDAGSAAGNGASTGIGIRLELARAALDLLASHPLTGTGPQTFHLLYPSLRTAAEQTTAGYFAHNDWLQIAHETGLPGALLLLAFVAWLLLTTGRRAVQAWSGDAHALIATGFGMAALGALAHGLVNFTLYVAPLALLIGIWAGVLARPLRVMVDEQLRAGVRLVQGLVLALMLAALALDALSATALMGHVGWPGRDWLRSPPVQQQVARALVTMNPDDSVPAAFLAEVRAREAASAADEESARYLLASAISYYELAVARDPYDRDAHLAYGALIGQLGGSVSLPGGAVRSDIELLDRAHRADPSDVRAVQALGARLFGEARHDEERAVLARWLPQCRVSSRRDPEAAGRLLTRANALALDAALQARCARAVALETGNER